MFFLRMLLLYQLDKHLFAKLTTEVIMCQCCVSSFFHCPHLGKIFVLVLYFGIGHIGGWVFSTSYLKQCG